MDYKCYYDKEKDGRYHVVFRNKTGLSINEIKILFSQYGNVLDVNWSGDIHGHRFVKFGTEAEAINCVKKLNHHEFITLLPNKSSRDKKTSQFEQKNENVTTKASDSVVNHKRQSQRADVESSKNQSDTESNHSTKLRNLMKHLDTRHNFNGLKMNASQNKQINNNTHETNTSLHIEAKDQLKHDFSRPEQIEQRNPVSCRRFSTNQRDAEDINTNHEAFLPRLVNAEDISEATLSSRSTSITDISEKYKHVVIAEDVIVANIHPDFGIFYILHLLEKYDPIGASLMKKVQKTNIRYCHIYFKTIQQALVVEEMFDNYILHGEGVKQNSSKNLIVRRVQSLLHEADLM